MRAKSIIEKSILDAEVVSKHRLVYACKAMENLYSQLVRALKEKSFQVESHLKEDYFAGKTSLLLNSPIDVRIRALIELAKIYKNKNLFLEGALLLSNALSGYSGEDESLTQELWMQLYSLENEYLKTTNRHNQQVINPQLFASSMMRYKGALRGAREDFKQNITIENSWIVHAKLAEDIKKITECIFKETFSLIDPIQTPFAVLALGSLAKGAMTPYSDLEYIFVQGSEITVSTLGFF